MPRRDMSLDRRVFGRRWAVARRSPKPAWVQIEEQLADRIESGAPGGRRAAPARARPGGALAVSRMTVRQALASLARARPRRARRRPRHVRARRRARRPRPRARVGFTEEVRAPGPGGRGARDVGAQADAAPAMSRVRCRSSPGARRAARARAARGGLPVMRRGHMAAARALPRPARQRTSPVALRADARALRPRARTAPERLEPVPARTQDATRSASRSAHR